MVLISIVGCSSAPRYMSGAYFERSYKMSKMQTLDSYSYVGETNGAIYMLRTRTPLVGSKLKEQVFFTETNGLTQGFVEQMKSEAVVEQGAAGNSHRARQ